jgi:hypothetical protein
MDVHASPAALPELHGFLSAFRVCFRRPEGREALERYTMGLLMQWDEADLNRQRVQKMIAEATTGDGVLVVDDTGFPKRGTPRWESRGGIRARWIKSGKLPGGGALLLYRSPGHVAGGRAVVPAAELGRRPCTSAAGTRAGDRMGMLRGGLNNCQGPATYSF